MKPRILFVDDEPNVLSNLKRMLRAQNSSWDMLFFDDPRAAWQHLAEHGADALVSDLKMPFLDGFQLLDRIRASDSLADLPVVILTGLGDRNLKREALDRGASDLLDKPIEEPDLRARLKNLLQLKAAQDKLKAHNEILEQRVQERTRDLAASRVDIIWRLGRVAEFRDKETGNHITRVACVSRLVASAMQLDREFTERLFLTAPLHDIGKIAIPDAILFKPGKLEPAEWAIMQQHCTIGAQLLQNDLQLKAAFSGWSFELETLATTDDNPLLRMAATIALTHHERWDGTGYPEKLAGIAIPLESRIVAIADVFDALTSERPYKPAYSREVAWRMIREGVGRHFDPEVFRAFERSLDEIYTVTERLRDGCSENTAEPVVELPT